MTFALDCKLGGAASWSFPECGKHSDDAGSENSEEDEDDEAAEEEEEEDEGGGTERHTNVRRAVRCGLLGLYRLARR